MYSLVRKIVLRFTKLSALAFLLFTIIIAIVNREFLLSLTGAFWLSYLFVGGNFLVLLKLNAEDSALFYKRYLIGVFVRFFLVLLALTIVIGVIKFQQIFFTVSFIISYIFHSVIEIIYINQALEKQPLK